MAGSIRPLLFYFRKSPLLVTLRPCFATQDQDCDRTATPIVGSRCQSRDRSFSSQQGAAEVNPDNKMEIDDKVQGVVKDAASTDSTTADTAYADTASSDTVAAEPLRKPLISGRDAGG